jgi:ParB-like chromosome segregation protein Spo0J
MIRIRPGDGGDIAPERASKTMKVFIQDVIVKDRYRKDMGDITALRKSIEKLGLLQPIGITKDKVLVFGERRLTACFALGWAEIEARIVDIDSLIEGEHDENEVRKAFTLSERLAIAQEIQRRIGNRQGQRTDIIEFKAKRQTNLKVIDPVKELPANWREVPAGEETTKESAKQAGFSSEQQMRRTAKVVNEGVPELVEALDKGEIAVSKAADLANLTSPEQIVSLHGEKAARTERDEAEHALLDEIRRYKLYHPANAYTDYVEKHRKRPDRNTASDIGRLIGGQVKADDGTMQPPKSQAQKQSEREAKSLRKEDEALRKQCRSITAAFGYLAFCKDDPKDVIKMIDRWETPAINENFEHAIDWFNRFAKEWRKHAK